MAAQGAAVHLPQAKLTPTALAAQLRTLQRPQLLAMAERARALAHPQAAARVADEIEALLARSGAGGRAA
jgi:UDP-N-acetylglucosamine--N-acetylmuramyl-(pentapeptide) pyrophosphoryl-undecaprenol N-acetylglucosamine transferase